MNLVIQALTFFIAVATAIRAILIAKITFDSIPIKEVIIALTKALFDQDWF